MDVLAELFNNYIDVPDDFLSIINSVQPSDWYLAEIDHTFGYLWQPGFRKGLKHGHRENAYSKEVALNNPKLYRQCIDEWMNTIGFTTLEEMTKYFPIYITYKNGLIHSYDDDPSVITLNMSTVVVSIPITNEHVSSVHYHDNGELIMSHYY